MVSSTVLEMATWTTSVTIGLAFLLRFHFQQVVAWGTDGHRITCLIAEPLLYERAEKAVSQLLPQSANGNLAGLCNWPDSVREVSKYKWTRELHWINTPNLECKYVYNRAINKFTQQLLDYSRKRIAKNPRTRVDKITGLVTKSTGLTTVSLWRQPLHIGFRSDGGGNNVSVSWYRRKTDLHHVWDTELVAKALKENYNSDPTAMADSILNNITDTWASEVDTWGFCRNYRSACPDVYASEGISLACKWAYKGATPGAALGDSYYMSRLPIVERRLAQGGVRLAAILNGIFDPKEPN